MYNTNGMETVESFWSSSAKIDFPNWKISH